MALITPWIPPIPQPPTLANVYATFFASRFVLVETLFWLGTLKMVAPRVYAGDVPLGWAPSRPPSFS